MTLQIVSEQPQNWPLPVGCDTWLISGTAKQCGELDQRASTSMHYNSIHGWRVSTYYYYYYYYCYYYLLLLISTIITVILNILIYIILSNHTEYLGWWTSIWRFTWLFHYPAIGPWDSCLFAEGTDATSGFWWMQLRLQMGITLELSTQ